jgi:hypothetical protein
MAIFTFLDQKGVLIRIVSTKSKAPFVRFQSYLTTVAREKIHPRPRRLPGIVLLLRLSGAGYEGLMKVRVASKIHNFAERTSP